MNVNNHQVNYSENCSEDIKEQIQKYWEINNDEFINKPKSIANSLGIPTHEVSILMRKHSSLAFEISCDRCNENTQHIVYSQTAYNQIARKSAYICQSCLDIIAENERIEVERIRQEKIKHLTDAIENKHWEKLNRYEYKMLYNLIIANNFNAFLNHYNSKKSKHFWAAIFKLRDLALIVLEYRQYGNTIINALYLKELSDALPPPSELDEEHTMKEDTSFNKETNELRFKLTKNPNSFSYDSPEYSGVLEFQQTVVLKPGIEYSFGAWKRQNDVLYLSIIPTEDKPLLPKQKNKEW